MSMTRLVQRSMKPVLPVSRCGMAFLSRETGGGRNGSRFPFPPSPPPDLPIASAEGGLGHDEWGWKAPRGPREGSAVSRVYAHKDMTEPNRPKFRPAQVITAAD